MEDVPNGSQIELWSLWIGDDEQKIDRKKLKLKELTVMDIEMIKNPSWCMMME